MDTDSETDNQSAEPTGTGLALPLIGVIVVTLGIVILLKRNGNDSAAPAYTSAEAQPSSSDQIRWGNFFNPSNQVTYLQGEEASAAVGHASVNTGTNSNVRHADYAGSQNCQECHAEKYRDWTSHAHRWMNAMAEPETVKGDFTGKKSIRYQGGVGTFFREENEYRMRTERSDRTRTYHVTRTIGSRFYQYYVGKLIESSQQEPADLRNVEHVLPFGYWIDEEEWVPTVHIFREPETEHTAVDSFVGERIVNYDLGCSRCHTTWPYGDWMITSSGNQRLSFYSPRNVTIEARRYIESEHPDLVTSRNSDSPGTVDEYAALVKQIEAQPYEQHRLELGITCEACHNGSKEHAANSTRTNTTVLPYFFPVHPLIHSEAKDFPSLVKKSDGNVNMICGRCHSGGRPVYANGIHTWNSTEFADGVQGFCYKRKTGSHADSPTLTCVHCHDPHESNGPKWKRTPQQDDQSCIECHQQFSTAKAIEAHTHHAPDSAGSHCMDCHMPKINEGLQDMVRTHRIFNPTDPAMIEANQPNACNLCHLDKPIDWTIKHLREWYGEQHRYAESKIFRNYPRRNQPVGKEWLNSAHNGTRLAAAEAMAITDAQRWLPELVEFMTEDTHLVNRQFIQRRLEESLGIKFRDQGFRFYMSREERREIMARLRPRLEATSKSKR